MQPYIFPYIGYFQLLNAVDEFVIYDNIQYTKKGWINRNRILVNGKDKLFTIPLKKGSDYLDIKERFLSDDVQTHQKKLLNLINQNYKKAPYFDSIYPLVESVISYDESNLFSFLGNSIRVLAKHLQINTKIIVSSSIDASHYLKGAERVVDICKRVGASQYFNPIGGTELYDVNEFSGEGIELHFVKTKPLVYPQFKNEFVPMLSIIDVMMFNSSEQVIAMLNEFDLL